MKRYYFFALATMSLFMVTNLSLAWEYGWTHHDDGLSTGRFDLGDTHNSKDSTLFVIRFDPENWELKALSITEQKLEKNLSVREWARQYGMVATINAGMYDVDRKTHIGYFQTSDHKNNGRLHSKYKSVIAFNPVGKSPAAQMFDLDVISLEKIEKSYSSIIQNERLIKKPGENRWSRGGKTWWSEAALGEDKDGRILFLYTQASFKMYDLNNRLLELPLDLVSAQHLEGGLPAQIYFNYEDVEIEFHSGHEVDFSREKNPVTGLGIPNVIGIKKK